MVEAILEFLGLVIELVGEALGFKIAKKRRQKLNGIKEYKVYNEEEILSLYKAVGWKAYTDNPKALRKGYQKSLLTLAAYKKGKLLGIIRTVGDGQTIVFIQDILVFPEYQRNGIGTALIKAVLERYKDVRQIELATDNRPETVAFYKSIGFSEFSEIGCCGFMKM